MLLDICLVEYEGPEQDRRPVRFRLFDGTDYTIEMAIALVRHHGVQFREWTDRGWKYLTVIHRNFGTSEFVG